MGKTFGSIIQIGALAAAAYFTGGAALGAALAGSATVASALSAVSVAAAGLAASSALGAIGGVLGLGPSMPKPPSAETAIKMPRRGALLSIEGEGA